ncbi:MAG: ferritin [Bacteroidota bacterium]
MKDLVKMNTSLGEKIEKMLNEQIRHEAHSSSTYLAMASWCDANGFENSANFFYEQADEERGHMLKLVHYVNDTGGRAISPEVSNIQQDYNSFRSVFEAALEQELAITESINRIADQCVQDKDYTTANFLNWYLDEQVEELYIARRCVELFDVIGEDGIGRYMIDKEIPTIEYKAG